MKANNRKKKKRKILCKQDTHGYEMMMINNNEEDQEKKVVICHKSTSDKGALGYDVCGRDEEPRPSADQNDFLKESNPELDSPFNS